MGHWQVFRCSQWINEAVWLVLGWCCLVLGKIHILTMMPLTEELFQIQRILCFTSNFVHHLGVIRFIRFISEDEIIKVLLQHLEQPESLIVLSISVHSDALPRFWYIDPSSKLLFLAYIPQILHHLVEDGHSCPLIKGIYPNECL